MNDAKAIEIETVVNLPLPGGLTKCYSFSGLPASIEDTVAIHFGGNMETLPLLRVHSRCMTGDVLKSLRCDCGEQLAEAIGLLHRHGGLLIYHDAEGRGIGLRAKMKAYALQEQGRDTVDANLDLGHPADARDFELTAKILLVLGVRTVECLLTNNPQKIEQIRRGGINIVKSVTTGVFVVDNNRDYLETKRVRFGHTITLPTAAVHHPQAGPPEKS
jgi:GTP cyclohydrolase II